MKPCKGKDVRKEWEGETIKQKKNKTGGTMTAICGIRV